MCFFVVIERGMSQLNTAKFFWSCSKELEILLQMLIREVELPIKELTTTS